MYPANHLVQRFGLRDYIPEAARASMEKEFLVLHVVPADAIVSRSWITSAGKLILPSRKREWNKPVTERILTDLILVAPPPTGRCRMPSPELARFLDYLGLI